MELFNTNAAVFLEIFCLQQVCGYRARGYAWLTVCHEPHLPSSVLLARAADLCPSPGTSLTSLTYSKACWFNIYNKCQHFS